MKYHRWKVIGNGVQCIRCGICQKKRGHITACPPTWFEMMIIKRLHYGDMTKPKSFNGLHHIAVKEANNEG